jgi:TPP-dependent pyruvate/acetoin dehydrogenase alpha subunit
VEAWRARDPIDGFERVLLERRVLSPDLVERLRAEVDERLAAAVEAGRQAPFPEVSEVSDHVYS